LLGARLLVIVKLFAAAADAAGCRQVEGPWAGLTPAQLMLALQERFPRLERIAPNLAVAINREFAESDQVIADGDEVALIPPVSGGAIDRPLFEVTSDPLSADEVAARVTTPHSGATLVFVGTVREWTKGRRTIHLEYEAYAEMAVHQMEVIGKEIAAQWAGARVAIVHRIGTLAVLEPSVVIAVATPHRADSFAACRHAIERLKQIVPIWKKEIWEDGEEWMGSQVGPDWMRT
jgi:molybdopterin synthase catalytic subunit/molybdopterin converting factor small subunit